jgi:acetyl esterase/lipase
MDRQAGKARGLLVVLAVAAICGTLGVPGAMAAQRDVIQNCWNDVGRHADATTSYLRFNGNHEIDLDVYRRVSGPTPHDAAVLVHGGGWSGGCRSWLDPLAVEMEQAGYLVFNVNYRLACTDPQVDLCGFSFPTQPNDVEAAITWVRANASTYGSFSGRVVAVGTSAGGNLVLMASTSSATPQGRPEVAAAFSPDPVLGYLSDGRFACDESADPAGCADAARAYVSMPLDNVRAICQDNWSPASPTCNVTADPAPSPAFVGNSTRELSPLLGARDYVDALTHLRPAVPTQLCTVSAHGGRLHGTDLLGRGVRCDGGTTVLDEMLSFLSTH